MLLCHYCCVELNVVTAALPFFLLKIAYFAFAGIYYGHALLMLPLLALCFPTSCCSGWVTCDIAAVEYVCGNIWCCKCWLCAVTFDVAGVKKRICGNVWCCTCWVSVIAFDAAFVESLTFLDNTRVVNKPITTQPKVTQHSAEATIMETVQIRKMIRTNSSSPQKVKKRVRQAGERN